MALTKAEKLINREGQKVECDFCHIRRVFIRGQWMMTEKKEAVCPLCQKTARENKKLLVSI